MTLNRSRVHGLSENQPNDGLSLLIVHAPVCMCMYLHTCTCIYSCSSAYGVCLSVLTQWSTHCGQSDLNPTPQRVPGSLSPRPLPSHQLSANLSSSGLLPPHSAAGQLGPLYESAAERRDPSPWGSQTREGTTWSVLKATFLLSNLQKGSRWAPSRGSNSAFYGHITLNNHNISVTGW